MNNELNGHNFESLCSWLETEISKITNKKDINYDEPFTNFGISSLDAVDLVANLGRFINEPLSPTLLFNYKTINELTTYLFSDRQGSIVSAVQTQKVQNEPIAIVGVGCQLPDSYSGQEFFNQILIGKNFITPVPKDRWDHKQYKCPNYGGFIREYDNFDNKFFKIPKAESNSMDPQQKLALMVSWQALEDAGINPKDISNQNVGVFLGISSSDYSFKKQKNNSQVNIFDGTGGAHSIAANRLSYFYNFKGPSVAIDTACSSSLVAIHLACDSLRKGESKLALAGGVNLILTPELSVAFNKAGMLASDGQCKTYSDDANGYVRGEGCGILVLKTLSEAQEAGDSILALIKGTAINQDGATNGLTAPNGLAQQQVIQQALANANIEAEEINFIEGHGTGTSLGDPIEYEAIAQVFKEKITPLYLGSVKTNVGHLEAAAGVTGVIKAAYTLKKKTLPPHLNFKKINSKIQTDNSNIIIPNEIVKLNESQTQHCGVSSFGFGGTNAHIILSSHSKPKVNLKKKINGLNNNIYILRVSANKDLNSVAKKYYDRLNIISNKDFKDFCVSSLLNRSSLSENIYILGSNKDDIQNSLLNFIDDKPDKNVIQSKLKAKAKPKKPLFMFTGQGSQSVAMGKGLYEWNPIFRDQFNKLIQLFQNFFEDNLFDVFFTENDKNIKLIKSTKFAQTYLFCLEYSLFKFWESIGISPGLMIGHSLGEISALACSQALSLESAVHLVYWRGHFMQETPNGRMSIVYDSSPSVLNLIEKNNLDKVTLATNNGPKLVTIGGSNFQIEKVHELLKSQNIKFKPLKVEQAFHSPLMDNILKPFENKLSHIQFRETKVNTISCLLQKTIEQKDLSPSFFSNHIRETTEFYPALKSIDFDSLPYVLEIGPHPTLLQMAQTFIKNPIHWIPSLNRNEGNELSVLKALCKIDLISQDIDWSKLYSKIEYKNNLIFTDLTKKINVTHTSQKTEATDMKKQDVINNMKSIVSEYMEIDISSISIDESLLNLGADSLVLLNTLEIIKESYEVEISVSDVFENMSTLSKIADHIIESMPKKAPHEPTTDHQESLIKSDLPVKQQVNNTAFHQISTPQSLSLQGNSEVQNVIEMQLKIMQQQLQVLGGNNAKKHQEITQNINKTVYSKSSSSPDESTTPPQSNTQKPNTGKGVLGNFSSQTNLTTGEELKNEQKKYLDSLLNKFTSKTSKTKSEIQKYRNTLADNRVSAGFRPALKEMVYPIMCKTASGAYFYDLDDNKYTDYTMGFGVNLFGHSPDFIQTEIEKQINAGFAVGPQSDLAGPVSQLLCELTGNDRATFLNSGTEAVMTAIRLARAKTKRNTIITFEGSYHGHADVILGRSNHNGITTVVAPGVPPGVIQDLVVLNYNDEASLNYIKNNASKIAGVVIEPVQSRYPEVQPKEFLIELRKLTKENDIAFIWDEVITGFRAAVGGAQEHFGIKADLASYGKVLGGGMPIGAVAGKAEYMNFIDGGPWSFGDNSYPKNEMTFFAGTFCKHPVTMAACLATLTKIKEQGKTLISDLNNKTQNLTDNLNSFFDELGVDLHIVNFSSLFRFKFTGNVDWLFYALNEKGHYIWEGRNMFLSTAHSQADIDLFIQDIKSTVKELVDIGYIKTKKKNKVDSNKNDIINWRSQPMIGPQLRFEKLNQLGNLGNLAATIFLAVEMKGDLHINHLKKSIQDTCNLIDSFSAQYEIDKKEVRFPSSISKKIKINEFDFSNLSSPQNELTKLLEQEAELGLSDHQNIEFNLVKLEKERYVLQLKVQHLASDGLSLAFLTDEIAKRYNKYAFDIPFREYNFRDFQSFMKSFNGEQKKMDDKRVFWEKECQKISPAPLQSSHLNAFRLHFNLTEDEYKKIRMFGYKNKSSLFTTLLSCFTTVACEEFNQKQLTLGYPSAGHTSLKEPLVGNCVLLFPMTVRPGDFANINELAKYLKNEKLTHSRNKDYFISEFNLNKKCSIIFNVEPIDEMPKFKNIKTDIVYHPIKSSEYPIMFNAMKVNGRLNVEVDFQESEVSVSRAQKFLDNFKQLLLNL